MRPYQEEYIANVKEFISLNLRPSPEDRSLEDYIERSQEQRARRKQLEQRNMELLREKLLPDLDSLSGADAEERQAIQEFSVKLLGSPKEVDVGLMCQLQQALVALARQEGNRADLIEHLYWLGLGHNAESRKLVNMDAVALRYYAQTRSYFEEAASYLKDFDKIEDEATQSYIIRSIANSALGQFPTVAERTRRLKAALEIMENPHYRALAPGLPWDLYVEKTHHLMVTSISHSEDRAMTGGDVADIMRSVYIVYRGAEPSPRQTFHRAAIEYYCGVRSLDDLLKQLERQIDEADSRDFTAEGMYALISLPAFYCLYRARNPEQIGERERFYLAGLYRRIQSYLDACPPEAENEHMSLYLRQFICTFVEIEQGIPYRDFLLRLIRHFSPELYTHNQAVAEVAKVLSGFLLDRDKTFFDDIPFLQEISDPEQKRRAVLDYAEGCGLFHDAGKVNYPGIHSCTARRWFPAEDEMGRWHTIAGCKLLRGRASTSRYAPAALGHHVWYNEDAAMSYPAEYRRSQCPERRMVDVIALADWLSKSQDEYRLAPGATYSLEKAMEQAADLGGRQFSPRITPLMLEKPVQAAVWQAMRSAVKIACRSIYQTVAES